MPETKHDEGGAWYDSMGFLAKHHSKSKEPMLKGKSDVNSCIAVCRHGISPLGYLLLAGSLPIKLIRLPCAHEGTGSNSTKRLPSKAPARPPVIAILAPDTREYSFH
ncbi:hypothetical protein VTL71DRAFT_16050, partial [Oculimacula yallundae]